MGNKVVSILSIAVACVSGWGTLNANAATRVIYGQDNRQDLYQVTDRQLIDLANSTVVLMRTSAIQSSSSGELRINSGTFGQEMGMCSSEPYADQPSAGFCSGTLIANNLILTAGHCITSASDCARTSFVFGYSVNAAGQFPTRTSSDQVYSCRRIIHREQVGTGADFGIIEIDRSVPDHQPLPMARRTTRNEMPNGTSLVMIGYPAGLPVKVAGGAAVRDNSKNGYFVANTDSYGGNSGSGVFNAISGEIEGVLVRGEQDYVSTPAGCSVSKVCADGACRGEDVTKISVVLPFLPNQAL